MQVSRIIFAIAFLLALAVSSAAAQGEHKQFTCARPPKDCKALRKAVNCAKWHGCRVALIKGKAGPATFRCGKFQAPKKICRCVRDGQCAEKGPTAQPTTPPPPSRSPTASPTILTTAAPTIPCMPPTGKCGDVKGNTAFLRANCVPTVYRGCSILRGGCAYTHPLPRCGDDAL